MIEFDKDLGQYDYMKFDKASLKELTLLEFNIENKIEEDLIASGFKLKRRIEIPRHLKEICQL